MIWVDSDGDFSNGAVRYQTTLTGSEYIASPVTIANGDYVTIGIIKPVVQFTFSSSNGLETSNPNIEISLNYATGSNVTVGYTIIGGRATGGTDYIFTNRTATILAGQTKTNIHPGTVNDILTEPDETIIFELSNPTGVVLGTNTQHTYTINDDDNTRKIDFTASGSSGSESTTPVTLTIQINNVDGSIQRL